MKKFWKIFCASVTLIGGTFLVKLSNEEWRELVDDYRGKNKKEKKRDFNRDNRPRDNKPEFKRKPKGPEMK